MNVPPREKQVKTTAARIAALRRGAAFGPRRALSLASSIVAGVVVGALLWRGGAWNSVPERGGVRLRPEAGTIIYANSCRMRARTVAHLVLQTQAGPATVIPLRGYRPEAPVRFTGGGFSGTIVPAGRGSVAVITAADVDPGPAATTLAAAVEWL